MDIDLETMGLTEVIRLQNRLSEVLRRRFTRRLALCFTDIEGSTEYFERFGDEAGRRLQQRHFDLLERAFAARGGRVVDTAGDGAFSCFPSAEACALALADLFNLLWEDNASRAGEEELSVRAGLHWGEVLTDGALVSGEAVNLCARVAESSAGGEIRATMDAFRELPNALKLRCSPLDAVPLKGIAEPVETLILAWQDTSLLPVSVRIDETGETVALPDQDLISFGRLRHGEGGAAGNDVVLALPDALATQGISRWHFELRRRPGGFVLRSVSSGLTEVDGVPIARGHGQEHAQEARVTPGTVVRVARVLTLRFLGATTNEADEASLVTKQTP